MKYRQPIGFKVTDTKLSIIEPTIQDNEEIDIIEFQKLEALFKIAEQIHKKMQQLSISIVKNQSFSNHNSNDINKQLDKIYIKYYEKI